MSEPVYILSKSQYENIVEKLDILIKQSGEEQAEDKKWLNSEEAKEMLGVSNTTLWHYRRQGKIKSRRIGRKLYFSAQEVNQLIENS